MNKERRNIEGEDSLEATHRGRFFRKKVCMFCHDPNLKVDYKDGKALLAFVNTDNGKILPRRITGMCAYHQRRVSNAVKKARILALLPFSSVQMKWR